MKLHPGREYWRSIEQLADDPRARGFLEREFPEAASELPEGVPRRTMLMLLGASLSMAGLVACRRPEEAIVPYVTAPEQVIPGVPMRYATNMPFGDQAFGLVVETHEGRPTKIEGNELHPASGGASSVWMQAALLDLYDPDRSRAVLRGGETSSWDELIRDWTEGEAALVADGGAGLAILSRGVVSPTLARLARKVAERFPASRWVAWDPVGDENVRRGAALATGRELSPVYHLDRADVVLCLDADLLHGETDALRHAAGFADRRRVRSTDDAMSRLWVAEAVLSVTGASADHRLRLPAGQIAPLIARLAGELARRGLTLDLPSGLPVSGLPGVSADWVAALADDLMTAGPRALVAAGRRQPPAVHAAALALNTALGGLGQTVTLEENRTGPRSSLAGLGDLAEAMRAGRVKTLVVLGSNPVHDAPADLDFSGALASVPRVIHLGARRDETGQSAHWHLPLAHFLEAWGDTRAVGGALGVAQPMIQPLYGGKSEIELAGLIADGEARTGLDLVRETWRGLLGESDFERRWQRVLHDGVLAGHADPAVEARPNPEVWAALDALARVEGPSADGLEIVFRASPALYDGRFANNGWLLELPDPVTKLTWDNAALLSPATARAAGVTNEDVVRVTHDGRELDLPVWIVPGQADHVVVLDLGWGRTAAGRVGNGRGVDAYRLRTAAAPDLARGARLSATGARYPLAQTQDHGTMQGRPIVREAALEHYRQEPTFAREAVEHSPLVSPWTEHAYDQGFQWGMAIDLNACIGCNACVIACQAENNVPIVGKEQVIEGREMHWLRIDRYFSGPAADALTGFGERPEIRLDDPQVVFQPVPCMHCENAPCEQVCPVAATVHDHEGLNTMAYNRCIGTRYCSNNCPYKVRRFNFFNYTKDTPESLRLAYNPDVTVRSRGVMEKCTYCTQRINAAKIDAKLGGRELADGDIRTACQQACPTRAISFGNIRDPKSAVSRQKALDRDYALLAELNNKPRTTYQAKLRNPRPDLSEGEGGHSA